MNDTLRKELRDIGGSKNARMFIDEHAVGVFSIAYTDVRPADSKSMLSKLGEFMYAHAGLDVVGYRALRYDVISETVYIQIKTM